MEAGRNVEVMWLTGRLVPDHKTIADFRKVYGRAIRVNAGDDAEFGQMGAQGVDQHGALTDE